MKDQQGRVIGLEKLNFQSSQDDPVKMAFEAFPV
jgi:hypothetical protein